MKKVEVLRVKEGGKCERNNEGGARDGTQWRL